MTDKQPEALRLADLIDANLAGAGDAEISSELRRLHEQNADYANTIDGLIISSCDDVARIVALEDLRDELLEALRGLLAAVQHSVCENSGPAQDAARAAISKAGGAA